VKSWPQCLAGVEGAASRVTVLNDFSEGGGKEGEGEESGSASESERERGSEGQRERGS
jgi:hypothetical protein